MSGRHVLVAGGSGFVGSHLCDRLLESGDRVTVVDDLSTGRLENLATASADPRFEFVEHDVCAPLPASVLDGDRFDAVLHLASPASPPAYLRRPIETLDVGSIGTRRLLELARAQGARFLLASTSEVYGDPLVHPQREDYWGNVNPIGERSVYDEAKRFAEALTMAYHRTHGVEVRIARIFNTYGPRLQPDDGRAVSNFCAQALRGEPLTVYGDGSQTRSFCYVDDLVRGLLALLDGDVTGPVNLGNPDEYTLLALAEAVLAATGSTSTIEFRPLPSDDPKVRCPDIGVATNQLGWTPEIDLHDGLGHMLEWLRSR